MASSDAYSFWLKLHDSFYVFTHYHAGSLLYPFNLIIRCFS